MSTASSAGEWTPERVIGLPRLGNNIRIDRYDIGHCQESHGACSEFGDEVRLPVGHIKISPHLRCIKDLGKIEYFTLSAA